MKRVAFVILKVISWIWILVGAIIALVARDTKGNMVLFSSSVIGVVIFVLIPVVFLIWRFKADKKVRIEKAKNKLEAKKEEIRVREELKEIEKQEKKLVKAELEATNIINNESKKEGTVETAYTDNRRVFAFEGTGAKAKVVIDSNWISIERNGFSNTMNYGRHGVKKLHIQDVSGVQFKEAKNINGGYLELILKSYDKNVNNGLLGLDENRIMFTKQYNDLAKELVREIENKIEELRVSNNGATIIQQNSQTKAQEIREFKELLDQGIITQEEFDKKKSQLLDS